MGANISATQQAIMSSVANQLSATIQQTNESVCSIKINSINISSCPFPVIQNYCTASTQAVSNALSTTLAQLYQQATAEQQAAVLPGYNVSGQSESVQTYIQNILSQTCSQTDINENLIDIGQIVAQNCTPGTTPTILNFGSATSNCMLAAALSSVAQVHQEAETVQTNTGLNLFGSATSWIIVGVVVVAIIVAIIILVVVLKKKKSAAVQV